ncbi:uncharacterized protein At3g28850-like [Phoenix dactylifera]|uniref:Uncharacterized protein At3g28850-like n=1 Tax=Phoenix dactylifera TaxID=42345 RepID=A0A8B7CR29_PHODC|nr:uncharacterized protein At3g28850-like [Phoenix dactylifera]
MGCTSSKQARRDRRRSLSPYARSYSVPLGPDAGAGCRKKGDGYHVVTLASSTLGSLKLDRGPRPDDLAGSDEEMMKSSNDCGRDRLADELGKAKAWSEMIEHRIPKTPTKTPPNEPETINAWELMEGLEDTSPLRPTSAADRSFSFHTTRDALPAPGSLPSSKLANGCLSPKPGWMQLGPGDSIISDFDPEILATFRNVLEEFSPPHPALERHLEPPEKVTDCRHSGDMPKFQGIVRARINAFQERIDARRASFNSNAAKVTPLDKCPPGGQGKVVFYFTSLRGIRKTYEDCWAVRVILQGYGVRIDERDVSMHGGFKEELKEILGAEYGSGRLPRIFADGKYLGGADEVRQMHEAGELGTAVEGCEMAAVGKGGGVVEACEGCGGVRFVPCETCSGSCKVYVVEDGKEEEEEAGFRRCPDCNENGLVRCPLCC